MSTILIVDDEPAVRFALREILESEGHLVQEACDGEAALARLGQGGVQLVISDLVMPGMDGMTLLRRSAELAPRPRFVMLTARGSERHAVQAIKAGAFDYLTKPFELDELCACVARALEVHKLAEENRKLRAELVLGRSMVFASPAMLAVAEAVERIAARDVTVLISGESGTGKELVAEAIHRASLRSERPMVRFSCAAVPDTLLEDALFGHTRGAFTGAEQARPGCFVQAEHSTLFLDEIGELSSLGQTRLLRALQEGEVQPLGGQVRKVDVRLIAATNRELAAEVSQGRFREDLYYRLNVVEIRLPPLAARREDLPLLVEHFFDKYRRRFRLESLQVPDAVRQRLLIGPWPGNVRQLEHQIERLVAFSREGVVEDVDGLCGVEQTQGELSLRERVDAYERGLLQAALTECGGNQSEAARHLGLNRGTLIDKMKKHSLR